MVLSRRTAFAWSLSVMTLVLAAAASDLRGLSTKPSSGSSSSLESTPTTKTDEALSGKPLRLKTSPCASNADCRNGGTCWRDPDFDNYCECKSGTSGDLCEVVDECARNPTMCGNGTDVQCGYDLVTKRAVCKCNNASKGFDSFVKKCRVPCTSKKCSTWIPCRKNVGDDLKFCRCPWGIDGDRCTEEVDECKKIGLDCGTNPNVTCLEGQKGESVCYCEVGGWSVAYDYEAKDCRKCECGGLNLGCRFYPNGTKSCYCDRQYYQKDGKCEDCGCGYGSNGCKLENGTKRCECWSFYLDNGGVCEKCDCGSNQKSCTFKNGQKSCDCKPGYIQADGICRKDCKGADSECKHGGKCVHGLCQCLSGTHGDTCEVVDGCEGAWEEKQKCGYSSRAYCDFNETSHEWYCRCKGTGDLFDPFDKECKACDCGPDGRCYFRFGQSMCDCKKGYVEKLTAWNRDNKCVPCNCGQRSTGCVFTGIDSIRCLCETGYEEKYGECSKCDCGRDGSCTFDVFGEKECDCLPGTADKNGYCTECDCGSNGKCEFNDEGEKICNCEEGYGDEDGQCSECSCWLDYYTTVNCTFTYGIQKCLCPEGYIEQSQTCRDINECLDPFACPQNTDCRNTKGSYTCTCKMGYRPWTDEQDPKRYGCTDMNECSEWNACPYRDTTECVNTQGSYYCRCKVGYFSPFTQYSVEKQGCQKDQSGWKTAYIVLSSVFLFIILLLLIAIIKKKLSS